MELFSVVALRYLDIDPEFSGNIQVLRKQNDFVNISQMSENLKICCGGVAGA